MRDVEEKIGRSERTIRRLLDRGDFPRPVRYPGCSSIGWLESDVDEWIQSLVDASRSSKEHVGAA